jgi:hypothetical protein
LPLLQEITAEEWASIPIKPGTPKYDKAREDFISERLDRKPPRKPPEEPAEAPPPAPVLEPPAAVRRIR